MERQAGPRSAPAAPSSSSSSVAAAQGHPARERVRSSRADAEVSPGEFGPDATMEVDPHRIGPVRMSYSPHTDGAPDPGEIVWTWVPFEENDGREWAEPAVDIPNSGSHTGMVSNPGPDARRAGPGIAWKERRAATRHAACRCASVVSGGGAGSSGGSASSTATAGTV
jgi:hypothetical protein